MLPHFETAKISLEKSAGPGFIRDEPFECVTAARRLG
jgi:hypothetical protein